MKKKVVWNIWGDNTASGVTLFGLLHENTFSHNHCLPKTWVLEQVGGGVYILTTGIGDSEVFFHSWRTGAPEMVIVDHDFASLLPVAPPG